MKRRIILIIIFVILIIAVFFTVIGIKISNMQKTGSLIVSGTKSLVKEEYKEARLNFLKVTLIDEEDEMAFELFVLADNCMQLDTLYISKEYLLAEELIKKIESNKYFKYVEDKMNDKFLIIQNKIITIKEIESLDTKIEELINTNSYQEAIDTVNKYFDDDLKEVYIDKLEELINTINKSKSEFEQEQLRIEEEKLAEEAKKEEINNDPYYQLRDYWFCNSCNFNTTVEGEMYINQNTLCAYCGATSGYHLEKDTRANVQNR